MKKSDRLKMIKEDKYLSYKLFSILSENLHFEIYQFLYFNEIIKFRLINLGGFVLASNQHIRSRLLSCPIYINRRGIGRIIESDIEEREKEEAIKIILELNSSDQIDLSVRKGNKHKCIGAIGARYISKHMKLCQKLTILNLCKYIPWYMNL